MMRSDYDHSPPGDHAHDNQPKEYPSPDMSQGGDNNWQNGGRRTPDSGHRLRPTISGSTTASGPPGGWDNESRKSGERNRSRQRNGRSASGQVRMCKKCGETLTGQFVRALDGTFHLDCFKCRDCGQIVASKFFPVDDEEGGGQYPLCETDYFRRLGLLCHQCGGALRGSYITALDRKYHVDHFTCSLCTTVFGAQDSYYEHSGDVYCHYHYSTQYAQKCNGGQVAILKQFVEIFRNGQNQHWHPECYMIHKFWNVRLTQPLEAPVEHAESDDPASRGLIRETEELMEEKVFRIWSTLSTFEESSAACISDMLLHVSNGSYVDGVLIAKRFMAHVEVLFHSTDRLDATMRTYNEKGLSYGREAKLLCKKIVSFFSLLSKTHDPGVLKPGVTPELLSLVTGLAHYLKLLIRICLQGALKLERETKTPGGLYQFLDGLTDFEPAKPEDGEASFLTSGARLSAKDSDHCIGCRKSVEDECAKSGDLRWHLNCVNCAGCRRELGRSLEQAKYSTKDRRIYCNQCVNAPPESLQPMEHITKLQQYVFLLKVALARLVDILRSNGTLPFGAGEAGANGSGEKGGKPSLMEPPRLASDARSKSYAGEDKEHRRESTYESTLNDVRRLRSTRLDRHLSSSVRQPRTSRVMNADGHGPRPGSAGGDANHQQQGSTDAMFRHNEGITLDDIPRIVAVEQSREQQQKRDRASRQDLFRSPMGDVPAHQRTQSTGRTQDLRLGDPMSASNNRRFFSELSGLEYFNVRHLAVMTMHPMVEHEFSLDELLSFIESRKPATFWKNLGKAFKNDKSKNVKKKGVFGVPLDNIIERDGAESTDGVGPGALRVPAIIDDIISSMRQMDLSVEGVFRKNGNIKKQQESVEKINAEGCDAVSFMDQPVVQLAALLKRYLRDLPDPLMTLKLYRLWITAAKIPDPVKKKQCLHLACCLLPKSHRDCLEILFFFLKWAGSFHQLDEEVGSKMDIRNLSTVIAPNILTNAAKTPSLDGEAIFVIDAVEMLISNIEEFCQVPDEISILLNDPTFLSGNGEIPTKEILKRFHERREHLPNTTVHEVYNRLDTSSRPPPRRVETDPAVLKLESTVRPIHDMPISVPHPNAQGTSPQQRWRGPSEPKPSTFNTQFSNNSETQIESSENNQRRDWRNSGWGRQGNGLGVGGNS